MKLPLPGSIKGMVTLIVLLALLPALGLIALTSWLKFRSDVDIVTQDALRSAGSIAARQTQIMDDTRLLLLTLSQADEVRRMDAAACRQLLGTISKSAPLYNDIRLFDAEGRVLASVDDKPQQLSEAELERFKEAQQSGRFTVHAFTFAADAQRPVLNCQFPVVWRGKTLGSLMASVLIGVDPSEIRSLTAKHIEHLHIVNMQGDILFGYPAATQHDQGLHNFLVNAALRAGQSAASSGLLRASDGLYTLYEKIGCRADKAPPLLMLLALSTDSLYAQLRDRLRDVLSVLAVALSSAVLVTLYLCNASLLKPVHYLLAAANSIREGRLDRRVGDEPMPGELRQLALSLDSLSHSLGERDNELTRASEMANAANQSKTDFLANMSHEIRTPMNAILGMTYLARKEKLSEQQRGYIDNIHAEAEKLLIIINDILDFSKLEAGKLEIEKVSVDLARLLDEVAANIGTEAGRKELTFSLERDGSLPGFIKADPVHLSQILNNLLLNAVKATEKGAVRLKCLADRSESARLELEFCISGGPGSAENVEQDRPQDESERQDGSSLREGGAGLSLAITRRLVRLMQGSLMASSGQEEDSVIFRLPCEELSSMDSGFADAGSIAASSALVGAGSGQAAPLAEPDISQADPLRNLRILLVEDNPVNQQIAEEILRSAGANVDVANNGFEALSKLEAAGLAYKIVLMDLQMPELDGFAAARRIRMDERRKNLPIIAMTAHSADEEWAACREAGMNDFVSKPLDVPVLLKTILKWTAR